MAKDAAAAQGAKALPKKAPVAAGTQERRRM